MIEKIEALRKYIQVHLKHLEEEVADFESKIVLYERQKEHSLKALYMGYQTQTKCEIETLKFILSQLN